MRDLLVLSCNARNADMPDGANAWPHRRDALLAHLAARAPDLLGMQELLAGPFDETRAALTAYHAIGVGREDGDRRGEFAAIFARRDRFDVLASGTLWLSETPDVVASVGWDAALTRTCTWARLHDRATGRPLLFANTHFDHVGDAARIQSARLLATRLPALTDGAPIVLTGDFNATEDHDAYRALTRDGGLVDAYRAVHPARQADEASFHGFADVTHGVRIDWILHSPDLAARSATIDRTRSPAGGFLSDHDLVDAVLA